MSFYGCHAEWNLGSPGGWDYARMAQRLGARAWEQIASLSGLKIDLDFNHPAFYPVEGFKDLLLRAEKRRGGAAPPFLIVLAAEETFDLVKENKNVVDALNLLPGIRAALAAPQHLRLQNGKVTFQDREVTLIFQDFNNATIVELQKTHDMQPLLRAIRDGLVVNPRGMEPGGDKGVFEYLCGGGEVSAGTRERTPWSRKFARRRTTGPAGESIEDLAEWARRHWREVVLKPAHGYSGHGIFVGILRTSSRDRDIQTALDAGNYIVQSLVPLGLWAESYPWLDHERKQAVLKRWQTDFRCFVTDRGLMGFVGRFGNIPTNVGSGGGVQSLAVLKSRLPVKEAVERINAAVLQIPYERLAAIEKETAEQAQRMGLVYLLGPIPTTLRPRLLTETQIQALEKYGRNLWQDAVIVEKMIRQGKLDHVLSTTPEESAIAGLQPWDGSPALLASDGLFGFGAGLDGDAAHD